VHFAFGEKKLAQAYFGPDVDVEECECCGAWSASAADHEDGAIIGPWVLPNGLNKYDRICNECDAVLDLEETLQSSG
jgi:hypothetical protein